MNATKTLAFEAPDRNRGQIVTYSFAQTPGGSTIERRHDGSDNSVTYTWQKSDRKLTARQLATYGLIAR